MGGNALRIGEPSSRSILEDLLGDGLEHRITAFNAAAEIRWLSWEEE